MMKAFICLTLILGTACGQVTSEFDEEAIQTLQENAAITQGFTDAVTAFENASGDAAKASAYEQLVLHDAAIVSANWTAPTEGWKLFEFTGSSSTIEDVKQQQHDKVFYTKAIAQSDAEAMKLRGSGALIREAMAKGETWAEHWLLEAAESTDDNMKRMMYWFSGEFGADMDQPARSVNWTEWQQAFNNANDLGKAILLKNLTLLAIYREEFTTAASIHTSILNGTDRELKAIALAYGHKDFGSGVTTLWEGIANDTSDTHLKALAEEALDE